MVDIHDAFYRDPAFLRCRRAIPSRPRRAHASVYGGARIASAADLAPLLGPARDAHTTVLEDVSPLLERPGGRGALEARYSVSLALDEELRNCHALVVGQPGSGKTTRFVLPLLAADLADAQRTVVIFDAKSNLYPIVRALVDRHRGGRGLHVLNPSNASRSVGWNPVRRGAAPQEVFLLAHQVCTASEPPAGGSESPFWLGSSTKLLADLLLGLCEDPRDVACLGRAFEVAHFSPRKFQTWARERDPHERLERFVEFFGSGSHNAATVLADLQMRLRPWMDRDVAAVTAGDELDLDRLVDEPSVLLVEMDETQIEKLRPLWNVLASQVFDRLLARSLEFPGGRLPRPVSLFLDEFASSIGRVPDMQVRLNTLRERRVAITAALQSLGQLEAVYGPEWRPVLGGFASKVYLPRLELADACHASKESGTTTVECETELRDPASGTEAPRFSHQVAPVPRPVFLPDEIMRPPAHFALDRPSTLFLAGYPPFQAWLRPAWELDTLAPTLRARSQGAGQQPLREEPLPWPPRSERRVQLRDVFDERPIAHTPSADGQLEEAAVDPHGLFRRPADQTEEDETD